MSFNSDRVDKKYPLPSPAMRHTVAFCDICKCQRTFSYGRCDSCRWDYVESDKEVSGA